MFKIPPIKKLLPEVQDVGFIPRETAPDAGFVLRELEPNANPNALGSNPFSGVTIDQTGVPVNLPRILPPETTPPINADAPAFNVPQPVQPIVQPNPIEQAQADYESAVMQPAQKQGIGKQILFKVLQAVGNVANGTNDQRMLGEYKRDFKINQAKQALDPLQQQQKISQDAALRDAQIKTIPIDDELKRQQIENTRILGGERLKSAALSKINSLKTYDPKNQAMRRLAEQAGLNPDEVGGWDFRNPVEHSINGVRFRLNRETGKYEQTDLPVDEEKQLVDFKTKDGKTYRVSAKTAATLQTQFDTLGMRQEYDEKKTERQQQFELKKQSIQQNFEREKMEFEKNDRDARQAKTAEEKLAAEARREESRKRIIDYQNQLEQEMLIFKKENK
jgi:hypothetical protein